MPEIKNNKCSEFKLIAIRPLKGCASKYSKNLTTGEIYKFYNDYEFIKEDINDIDSEILEIKSIQSIPENFFSKGPLTLNISAVVGKNGSGKSTLLEFIYLTGFLLAEKYDHIEELKWMSKDENPNQFFDPNNIDNYQSLLSVRFNLKFELYFSINNKVYRLINNGEDIIYSQRQIKRNNKSFWKTVTNEKINSFFYSIITNYSLYGLNENLNPWLSPLFHKNDGYQTPIVINPYRNNGNINVNSEHHLAQSRVLSNLESLNGLEVLESKELEGVNFEFAPNKLSTLNSVSFKSVLKLYGEDPMLIFEKLFEKLFDSEFNYKSSTKELIREMIIAEDDDYKFEEIERDIDYSKLEVYLIKYVIYKVFKLCITDKDYKFSYTRLVKINDVKLSTLKDIDALTHDIAANKSHLTLKIRQIMNVIKSRFFDIETITIKESSFDRKLYAFHISLSIDEYITLKNDRLNNLKKDKDDPLEFTPTAFGVVSLFVKDRINNDQDSSFKTLSSGEQQLLLSLQTIYYHLYNLNSVDKSQGKTKYSNICIIIDEVELYFHPEFQRRFVSELIQGLNKMSIKNIKSLNIIFSTHSPFILSDIPTNNVLRLKNGKPASIKGGSNTFGANIHDLLANDFFLENGFMGEFAKTQIEETIEYLNSEIFKIEKSELTKKLKNKELKESKKKVYENELKEINKNLDSIKVKNSNREFHQNVIQLIGEPILRNKLGEMMASIMSNENKKKYLEEQFNIMAKNAGININNIKFED